MTDRSLSTSRTPSWRWLWLATLLPASACAVDGSDPSRWQFDPAFLAGTGLSAETIQRFNQPATVLPGIHHVELHVNGRFIARMDIRFVQANDGTTRPCLNHAQWLETGVSAEVIQRHANESQETCPALSDVVAGSSSQLDPAHLKLHLSLPQAMMQRNAPDSVPLDQLDAGTGIVFFNYMGNLWHAEHSGSQWIKHQDSAFLSLSGGVNLGLWQYRQQGHLAASNGQSPHWHNINSHLQRPLPELAGGSELRLGQLSTSGQFFSGLSYTGLRLASDERSRPASQRGFAPEVRGIANSNARISIRQQGRMIYQTTVSPGPFVIDDLSPTSYNGDLEVTVEEADGTTHTFKVPFSALPESLRPGHSRYAIAMGRTRDGAQAGFTDVSVQHGISNQISAGAGVRVALGYQAVAAQAAWLTRAGTLGLAINHSHTGHPDGRSTSGTMAGLSYSRTFAATNTHVAIAAWRYSTAGYREFHSSPDTAAHAPPQRARLDLHLSQPLGKAGQVFVSASGQNWHHTHRHDHQWQLGYSTQWDNGISLNLSLIRQFLSALPHPSGTGAWQDTTRDTAFNLSLSIPLGGTSAPTLNSGYSHDLGGGQYDVDLSGQHGEAFSYNLGASHTTARQDGGRDIVWHASLQQRLPNASLGLNVSQGAHHWQAAANVQGALAVHAGGVTFGPWLGETFALIEAQGASGARVGGSGQARIDRHGYALLPSLMPYHHNRIRIDPQGAADTLELDEAEQHTAPYAGAAVKLDFHAKHGQALLIHVDPPEGQNLPPGTEALDAAGNAIGMLGQGNWLYLRSEHPQGQLQLRWGAGANEHCQLDYDFRSLKPSSLLRLHAACKPPGTPPPPEPSPT